MIFMSFQHITIGKLIGFDLNRNSLEDFWIYFSIHGNLQVTLNAPVMMDNG